VLATKYGARVAGAALEKQWGLVLPEGQIYSFLDNEQYRKLLAAGLPGKAVEIHARLFPRSMLLEVLGFKEIPADTLRRRFHCDVCALYVEEFGPCVCCGKEVVLVKDEK
jgi:hypothetical protein